MGARTSHPHGTPSWVDLGAPDVDRAAAFYSALLGWDVQDAGPPEETGGYRLAMLDGKAVAGLGPATDPGPPRWTTYITVDDVDATTEQARAAGGMVFLEPMDVLTAGRMAVLADPTGAAFAIWQAGEHIGAELVNVPGALCWNELNSRNIDDAKGFYADLFGWEYEGGDEYWQFNVGGRPSGGMLPMPDGSPPDMPNHWLTYFAVENRDAAVDEVQELGGVVHVADLSAGDVGRFSVVADDQGAAFCVIELVKADD